MKRIYILVLIILASLANTYSAETKILDIYEIDTEKNNISILASTLDIVTDKDDSILRVIGNVLNEDGSLYDQVHIYPEELIDGKVLKSEFGVTILSLSSDNFNILTGGQIVIEYLFKYEINPFKKNKYLSFPIELKRDGKDWSLSATNRPMKTLKMFSYKLGIKGIEAL